MIDRTDRVCVVGAGSSGLAAAKNLMEQGIDCDVLERENDLGGNWNFGKPNSRVYRSTHTITSKKTTQYVDFPMPDDYPEYPHHTQILAYLRSYAEHFKILPKIEFSTGVGHIDPCAQQRYWDVKVGNGEHRRYGAVVIANGHNWSPKWPEYPGQFTGATMHSAQYKTPDVLVGKRVLVVGGGNSGCDLAVEAAQSGCPTWHSTRRAYYYIPKFLFGRPADRLGQKLLRLGLPLGVRRFIMSSLLKLLVGKQEKFGLPKPDHKLYETHPLVNSLLPYYVSHGDIKPKPEIERFEDKHVHFVDGSSIEVDMIVYATGYNVVFPFIEKEHLNWRDGKPRLYLNVFHPQHDNLFVAGLIQPDSGQFGLVDWQTRCIAAFLRAVRDDAPAADTLRKAKREAEKDLGNGIRYKNTTRHYFQIEHWSYRQTLRQHIDTLTRVPQRRAA